MSQLFISYARKDIDFVKRIVTALESSGFEAWIDLDDIPKGENWEQEIYRNIDQVQAFLFMVSPASVASLMCAKEIAHAVRNGKRILPIFISNVAVAEVNLAFCEQKSREEISKRNYLFCRPGIDDFDQALEEIHNTIRTDYEWLKYHTKLQAKALDWELKRDNTQLLRAKELREAEQQLTSRGAQSDPQPTKVQREYLLASRRFGERQRRFIITGLSVALVVMAFLSIFAWDQRNEAVFQKATAQAASTLALAQRSTAVAEKDRADLQANIALAKQLAVQGQMSLSSTPPLVLLSSLLSIESLIRYPSAEADKTLRQGLLLYPNSVTYFKQASPVQVIAFSPDGRKLLSAGEDGKLYIWDAGTGEQITGINAEANITVAGFSPDGRLVLSGDTNGIARIWDSKTGIEVSRLRQGDYVFDAEFSPDGQFVASVGCDRFDARVCVSSTLLIWEPHSGKTLNRFSQDKGNYWAVAISADGRLVAAGGCGELLKIIVSDNITVYDCPKGQVRVWEALSGLDVVQTVPESIVVDIAFSHDGRWIISGGRDNAVYIWEIETGKEIARMDHDNWITQIAISEDDQWIVSASTDKTARVWNAVTGKEVFRIPHSDTVNSVAISRDTNWIVSGSQDQTAQLWERENRKQVAVTSHDASVRTVSISPNEDSLVASGDADGVIHVWDVKTGQDSELIHQEERALNFLEMNLEKNWIITGGNNTQVWDMATWKKLFEIESGYVYDYAMSPDQERLAIASYTGAGVWNSKNGEYEFPIYDIEKAFTVAFSLDGKYVASGSEYGILHIKELTGKETISIQHGSSITAIAFSPDGRMIASGGCDQFADSVCTDASLWVSETVTGERIAQTSFEGNINEVLFSNDGKRVIAGGLDGKIKILNLLTGNTITMRHKDLVSSIVLSPDNQRIVSGSGDKTVRFWDISTGGEIGNILHKDTVRVVKFSESGNFVLSGSEDGEIHVWDVSKQIEVAVLLNNSRINDLVMTPDDRQIISVDESGAIRIWLWMAEDLRAQACKYLMRNLTYEEWKKYLGNEQYHATCPNLPVEIAPVEHLVP